MKHNKYKVLVLSNLNESTSNVIKNTVSLAHIIGADIELFHVKKPTEIVETESQLSAMRTISEAHIDTEKKIKSLYDSCSKAYDVNINTSFSFGNVKSEISKYIKTNRPDVIVLGKRKPKTFNLTGDSITDYVLDIYDGAVMIAADSHILETGNKPSLGFFNTENQSSELKFTKELIGQSDQPLRSFHIFDKTNTTEPKMDNTTTKTINYVFEKNDNTYKTISNYLIKNEVDLLCVDRNYLSKNGKGDSTKLKDVVDKVDVSLFLTVENESNLS